MNENKEQLRTRMWEIQELLVDHDHRDSGEDGCVCGDLYEERNVIWHKLNDHKPQFQPRAGPRPPGGSDEHPSVDLENWQYLKDNEPQDAD